jgi:hypothetical protein
MRMRRSAFSVPTLALALSALLIGPGRLGAQVTFDVGPLVGYYRPLGHFDPATVFETDLPDTPSGLSGLAWGGAARLAFAHRLGIEAELSVTNSSVREVATPGGPRGPTGAQVVIATALGQLDLSRDPAGYHAWLGVGPAFVRHGGDAYAPHGSPTSVGGALGGGISYPLRGHLRIEANATAVFYSFDVPMPAQILAPGSLEHGFQKDALVQLGLRWATR